MSKIGDKVQCRFFNTPDGKFYGDFMTGEILEIGDHYFRYATEGITEKAYLVRFKHQPHMPIWLHRKEIKRVLK